MDQRSMADTTIQQGYHTICAGYNP